MLAAKHPNSSPPVPCAQEVSGPKTNNPGLFDVCAGLKGRVVPNIPPSEPSHSCVNSSWLLHWGSSTLTCRGGTGWGGESMRCVACACQALSCLHCYTTDLMFLCCVCPVLVYYVCRVLAL